MPSEKESLKKVVEGARKAGISDENIRGYISLEKTVREEDRDEKARKQVGVTSSILETKQKSSSAFEQRRDNFMSEVNGNGEYRNIPYDIGRSHSTKPGRVVRYNDYQSARKYQKKYGQSR